MIQPLVKAFQSVCPEPVVNASALQACFFQARVLAKVNDSRFFIPFFPSQPAKTRLLHYFTKYLPENERGRFKRFSNFSDRQKQYIPIVAKLSQSELSRAGSF
jgi:hypothetical protein